MNYFYFKKVVSRVTNPRVTAVLSCQFHGIQELPERNRIEPGYRCEPLRVYKNVYNISPLFMVDLHLVAKRSIADALRDAGAKIEARPIHITHPYYFEYRAGDLAYETDPTYLQLTAVTDVDEEGVDGLIRKLAKPFAVPFEGEYVEIAMYMRDKHSRHKFETLEVRDSSLGIGYQELEISPYEIEMCGIMWECGFVCTEKIYEILRPTLDTPFIGVIPLKL